MGRLDNTNDLSDVATERQNLGFCKPRAGTTKKKVTRRWSALASSFTGQKERKEGNEGEESELRSHKMATRRWSALGNHSPAKSKKQEESGQKCMSLQKDEEPNKRKAARRWSALARSSTTQKEKYGKDSEGGQKRKIKATRRWSALGYSPASQTEEVGTQRSKLERGGTDNIDRRKSEIDILSQKSNEKQKMTTTESKERIVEALVTTAQSPARRSSLGDSLSETQSTAHGSEGEIRAEISSHDTEWDGKDKEKYPRWGRNRLLEIGDFPTLRAASTVDKTADSLLQHGEIDRAYHYYEHALELKTAALQAGQDAATTTEERKSEILASVATSINNITVLRQRAGQGTSQDSMIAYLKSLEIKQEVLGADHLSVGKTLNNIGTLLHLKKSYEQALESFSYAYEIMSAKLDADHLQIGTLLSNMGDSHAALGQVEDALTCYRRAIDIRWTRLGPTDPKVARLLERAALLETGQQPKRNDEELSESEDEEYVQEDRRRCNDFRNDLRQVHEEIVEDTKFIGLVGKATEVDVSKEKARIKHVMHKARNGMSIRSYMFESGYSFDDTFVDSCNYVDSDDECEKSRASIASTLRRPNSHVSVRSKKGVLGTEDNFNSGRSQKSALRSDHSI